MINQNLKLKSKLGLTSYPNNIPKKFEDRKWKDNLCPSRNNKKRKSAKMKKTFQKYKKNNIKRNYYRKNKPINKEVNNNIVDSFTLSNINLENGLNIRHSFSPVENDHLQISNLNAENNRLRNNIFNEENFGSKFNISLSIENNIINLTSLHEGNDEELLDISALNNISCNHPNKMERNLFDILPEVKIENIINLSYENCMICLNNFIIDELIITLPCNHIFHSSCLRKWICFKGVCPLCKTDIDKWRN